MTDPRSLNELAAEYVAGTLGNGQMQSFADRLVEDAEAREAVAAWEAQIETFLGTIATAAFRAGNKPWVEIAPGITGQALHYDHQVGSMVYLVRLAPDADCPQAQTGSPEECLVVSGDLSLAEVTLKSGDSHHAPNSVIHGGGHSETGAVLFIRARDA